MKLKKNCAIVMAIMMVFSLFPSLLTTQVKATGTAEPMTDVTVTSFLGQGTTPKTHKGDFNVTYNFTNTSTGTKYHENYVVDLYDASNHHIWVRADNYVMNTAAGLAEVTGQLGAAQIDDAWAAKMKEGASCTVTVARVGDFVKYTLTTGEQVIAGIVAAAELDAETFIRISGENVNLTGITYTENTLLDNLELDADAFNTSCASKVSLNGDFDVTYTYHNVSKDTSQNYFNSAVELRWNDGSGDAGVTRTEDSAWTFGDSGSVLLQKGDPEWKKGYSLDNFKATMAQGVDCVVNAKRTGKTITVVCDSSIKKQTFTVTLEKLKDMTEDGSGGVVFLSIGGEKVTLSNIAFSKDSQCKYGLSPFRKGDLSYPVTFDTGKIFAGWYEDAEYTKPIGADVKTGTAYAKFADPQLLTAKYQLTAGTTADSSETAVRLLLGVDSLKYSKVGFKVKYDKGSVHDLSSATVYENISITESGQTMTVPVTDHFGSTAKYILPYKITGVQKADFGKSFQVTPYWVTMDGTTVEGEQRTFTVTEGLSA